MKRAQCKAVWMVPALLLLSPVQGQPNRCSDLLFEHVETLSNHQGLWNLDIGDLDGDQDLDLVSVGMYEGGIFSVFRNRGDGSFETPTLYTVGDDPRCILLEDLDGDSDLDLIVSNSLGGKLFVYTNPGTGVFGLPSAEYDFPEGRPMYFAAGDLDGDNDLDLAVNYMPFGHILVVWNRGDGRFDLGQSYRITPRYLYEIVAKDFDGDADLDLAVLALEFENWDWVSRVYVLTNNGSGGFGDLRGYDVPKNATVALASADLDNDSDKDLAGVTNSGSVPYIDAMWVIRNDGTGHFGTATTYLVGGRWPYDVHFGDLDRDGDLDAVVPNHRFADEPPPHDVSILLNRGDGTFEEERREIVGYKPIAAVPADLDNDLDLDIVVANFAGYGHPSSISVLFNLCDHQLPGDLDSDGDVDLFDCAVFQSCFTGVDGGPVTPQCGAGDFDVDDDIDLRDWGRFQAAFAGP